MRRKRLLFSVGLLLGFVVLVLLGLAAMVKHVPSYYEQATMREGRDREQLSSEATGAYVTAGNALLHGEPTWDVTLTTDQVNAYFQQDYFNHGGDANLSEGFSGPRVKFEEGKMRVGVRYGEGVLSTILTLEIKLWLVPGQMNVLAMEIVSLQAGSLPLSTGTLLDYISQFARRENIDITWYRHDGHPVAIMRFQSDLTRPTFRFEQLELKGNKLTIVGRATDLLAAPPPRVVSKGAGNAGGP
jgi:hypothetical protein